MIETKELKLKINLDGFKIEWFGKQEEAWIKIAQDRKTQAYNFGYWGDKLYHYLERDLKEQYFGFGERTGKVNKHFRRMKMQNVDPMGMMLNIQIHYINTFHFILQEIKKQNILLEFSMIILQLLFLRWEQN